MIKVEFLGPLGDKTITSEAKSLYELKEELKQNKELESWLPTCAIALNDVLVSSLDTPLKEGDRISLLPPVCGG